MVKPMEEEEPSLVKKRSREQLDSAQKCAMKRWSEGREQARFARDEWLEHAAKCVVVD